ncbi:hypothetical protein PI125_g21831 [Phytophthora idaei]|nr:hypothetical protein PI125_g21831 [Phytophthora idaei]
MGLLQPLGEAIQDGHYGSKKTLSSFPITLPLSQREFRSFSCHPNTPLTKLTLSGPFADAG